jgi:hypothetical protein
MGYRSGEKIGKVYRSSVILFLCLLFISLLIIPAGKTATSQKSSYEKIYGVKQK